MRLMLYEMNLFMQRDVEETLRRISVEYRVFMYPFVPTTAEEDIFFEKKFEDALSSGEYDGVISVNYWAPIARCCHRLNIPYIAWVYDCPFGVTQSEVTLRLPTNHIFVFDRAICESLWKREINTVYHHPLAVNLSRIDGIQLSSNEEKGYEAGVSFVGSLYSSGYNDVLGRLDDYLSGYLEGVVESQSRVYGAYFLNELLREDVLDKISDKLNAGGSIGVDENRDELEKKRLFGEWVQSLVAKEITRRDRLMILAALAEQCRVAVYTNVDEPLLNKAEFRGTVGSSDDIYKVYRKSRINLNITFRRIVTGIPLRAIDIMGAGGFLLTNYQEEICEHFRPGVDCAVYESIEDALAQAMYYLEHEDERREIAANGHERIKEFTFEKQLKSMLDMVFLGN